MPKDNGGNHSDMPVSDRVREIERAIDAHIAGLAVWRQPKAHLLERLMRTYRDAIEVTVLVHLFFEVKGPSLGVTPNDVAVLFSEEHRHRTGTLWALKWAEQFCPDEGSSADVAAESLVGLLALGAKYEAFVDVLKEANRGAIDIRVDENTKTLICYEGARALASDSDIVVHQRFAGPLSRHMSLTDDGDPLTSRWTAGDYRRVTATLTTQAAAKENDIVADLSVYFGPGAGELIVPQPTVVWLDRPTVVPDCHVFDDLVLPTDGRLAIWKLVALLDTPLVKIGKRYCALSSDLRAISQIDDHMLRLAALVDSTSYSRASLLREDRMIARCRAALESASPPWTVKTQVKFSAPAQEADVLAHRGADRLVIELKSTLRPETPWEVSKRNEEIIRGVSQAKALVDRGVATQGLVITDGYRGDYACWSAAEQHCIPIGTLEDLADIAKNPDAARSFLSQRVGIPASPTMEPLPDREEELAGWNIRLVDGPGPPL
jgi:hypothetical protein